DLDMDAIEEYYGNDQNRYTTVRPYDDDLCKNPREVYLSDANEFGKVIVASVPVYSTENNFIGYMTIDMFY
ncbi:MAG: hypothetical protein RR661_02975, partial [Anaerovoracaceae bacterium]